MAYNPFDFFRKNQKIFFAVLTIIVMFMFVLSFGQGDFFSWFPQWLSSKRSVGEVMAKVDGSSIRESDLSAINANRVLANQFMNAAAERELAALDQKFRDVQSSSSKVSEENRMAILLPVFMLQQELRQMRTEDDVERVRKTMLQSRSELAALIAKPGTRSEDKEAAQAVSNLLRAQMLRFAQAATSGRRGDGAVYFTGVPNRTMKDQMEFHLWLKKADQLGIRYTAEDVKGLVDGEFPNVTRQDLDTLAAEAIRSGARRRADNDLTNALADEFRVRAAQTAVLGPTEVRFHGGFPTQVPYDYFDFYRRETSPTQYTFLSVPVEPFMAQVTEKPTEQELKRIFTDAKGVEPDPMNPKAGIREPRKIKVQWAEITGQEPFYAALAEERMKKVADTRMSLLLAMPLGAGIVGNAVAPVAFKDLKYDEYKQTQANIAKLWTESRSNPGLPLTNTDALTLVFGGAVKADPLVTSRFAFTATADSSAKLADATLARPHTAGVLAGLLGGSLATHGSLMTAPVALAEAGYAAEKEQRLITGVQAFLVPTLPGLAQMVELTGADMAVLAALPQPLPQTQVQPTLDQITKNELRYKVAVEDVRAFEAKLAETMKAEDKTAAAKQAAEQMTAFIKERGLKTGGSTDLRDMHTIADDPGLAPLIPKSGVTDRLLGTLSNSLRKTVFGRMLFFTEKRNPFDPQSQPQLAPATGLYAPIAYPPTSDNQFRLGELTPLLLTWRTEETKAESPREFNDPLVQAKCEQIWKRNKARELARKAVDEALAKVKEAGESAVKVNQNLQDALAALQAKFPNPADKSRFRLIDNPKYSVANLVRGEMNEFSRPDQVPPLQPFFLQQGDDFVYPTRKMSEELLANRDKPVGTGVVLADAPETTYYAAVVSSKDEANPLIFQMTVYKRPTRPNFGFAPPDAKEIVEARYAIDARKAARDQAVALLKAEFGYADENPELAKKASEAAE